MMERLGKRLGSLFSRRTEKARRIPVAEKFTCFRRIGAANDAFLGRLAALMEAQDHGTVSRSDLYSAVESLSEQTGTMVNAFLAMTGGGHEALLHQYEALEESIRRQAEQARPGDSSPLVVWPREEDAFRPHVVGPKAARLAEVASKTRLNIPAFFSVSASGYRLFMRESGIQTLVGSLFPSTDLRDPQKIKSLSEIIARAFDEAPVPPELESILLEACARLLRSHPDATGVAVRSSAIVEDSESSFAGQFESILNVRPDQLIAAYKQVIASKYRQQALRYAMARGCLGEDIPMPVLVMVMIQPSASGVAYSRCPGREQSAMVTAVPGLAQALVEGKITPDTFLVSMGPTVRVEDAVIGSRPFALRCAADGGLRRQQEKTLGLLPALGEEAVCEVASAARTLEEVYGAPQDVEWAIDEAGSLQIVQTRPVYFSASQSTSSALRQVEGYRVLLRGGARASGGVTTGKVFLLPDLEAMDTVPEGVILCVPTTSPRLAGLMGMVSGIVAAAGSPTGHMATIAREFDVPCLVGAENALSALREGAAVTLDADAGVVYEGEVHELLGPNPPAGAASGRKYPVPEDLKQLVQKVAPLTLGEPDTPEFSPANCRTLHDIARYVHQKSMAEMFQSEHLSAQERRASRRLTWRVPMDVLLLDLGGGLAPIAERNVPIDKVTSIPLLALMEGMTDPRLRWAGPVGFDLRGFMSVVVRSAADDQRYGEPNYCLCAADYVHFATRLAYHFATVESICGGSVNENYVRFLFFGGAAVAERREWRAHFLAQVLRSNAFAVKQVGDRLEAFLAKRIASVTEEALVMVGRLMVASRHLDMVIENPVAANALAQAFLSGDYGFESVSKTGK